MIDNETVKKLSFFVNSINEICEKYCLMTHKMTFFQKKNIFLSFELKLLVQWYVSFIFIFVMDAR